MTPIDRSKGRVSILDGDLFYSPNCSRSVGVPPPNWDRGEMYNIFKPGMIIHEPRWWTKTFGWMAFVPINPSYRGIPFDALAYLPFPEQGEDGYVIPARVKDRWARLEDALVRATAILAQKYEFAAIRPYTPWHFGYHKSFNSPRTANECFAGSRMWFTVWMGLFSFAIASGESVVEEASYLANKSIPRWFEVLAGGGFDQAWLTGIHSSTVCSFRPETERVGLFVHIKPEEVEQPWIPWFCSYHIPVWYPWGEEEARMVQEDPSLAQFAPLPEQLQVGTTILVREPSGEFGRPSQDTGRQGTMNTGAPPAWKEFFAERDELNARRMASETPSDRQKRLDREKHPPTTSAKVFEWNYSSDDLTRLVRELVPKRSRWEVLSLYTAGQKRYDPWRNEWDCCEEFEPGATVADDMEDVVVLTRHRDEVDTTDTFCAPSSPPRVIASPPRTCSPLPSTDGAHESDSPSLDLIGIYAYESVEVLSQHYGFVPPLPVPSIPAINKMDLREQKEFLRLLGLTIFEEGFFTMRISEIAMEFTTRLAKAQRPEVETWDLEEGNRIPLASVWRLTKLRCISDNLYLFDFEGASAFKWKLAVTCAADVLHVCRLDSQLDNYEVARHLLQQGIPFYTLRPLIKVPPALPTPSTHVLLPIRLSGYTFTPKDYEAYQRQCDTIFNQPRARALLLRGGIVWRLVVEILSWDDALRGPSISATCHQSGFSVKDPQSGDWLGDDDFTQLELDLLCGAYVCYTGHGNQTAIKSWFPLTSTFDLAGENYGRWTPYNENWFKDRIVQIRAGAQPLPANKWRDHTRGSKRVRMLKSNTSAFAKEFISAYSSR